MMVAGQHQSRLNYSDNVRYIWGVIQRRETALSWSRNNQTITIIAANTPQHSFGTCHRQPLDLRRVSLQVKEANLDEESWLLSLIPRLSNAGRSGRSPTKHVSIWQPGNDTQQSTDNIVQNRPTLWQGKKALVTTKTAVPTQWSLKLLVQNTRQKTNK